MIVQHVSAKMAPKGRRRTYRAHGRINAYMSNPAHLELVLASKPEAVPAEKEKVAPRLFVRKQARRTKAAKVPEGGDA